MVLREAVTMRCELFVKPIQKCLLSYLAFMWHFSKTNCMYQMWMIQAMSCAPQLPTSTSPQKKSARMEVVWISDQILQWRRPLPKTWSILHLKVFLMLKLLSNYDLFTRLNQLPQTTTCLQILAQVFHRWNILSDFKSMIVKKCWKSRGEYLSKKY